MDLPFDELLGALVELDDADAAWRACCAALDSTHPAPIWPKLGRLKPSGDVADTAEWLSAQLADAASFLGEVSGTGPRGIVIWLDPQSFADGEGWCLEIGATADCDPQGDDLEWIERCPWFGDFHLPRGLLKAEDLWLDPDHAEVRELAEYACFLLYCGLVLRDALAGAGLEGPWVVAWGFPEGDQGLLARGEGVDVTPLGLLA